MGPNQVWSWDITKLAGPYKWTWYQLYTILDIYSRYVVGWLIAPTESAKLAEQLIADAIYTHHVDHDQLTLHATGQLNDVTHRLPAPRRPRCAPEPLKAAPIQRQPLLRSTVQDPQILADVPETVRQHAQARGFCDTFFDYYNNEHRHSGIALNTPANVHYGLDDIVRQKRQGGLDTAYTNRPDRFTKPPQAPHVPDATWINRPAEEPATN